MELSPVAINAIQRKSGKRRWEFRWPAQPFFEDCFRDDEFAFRIEARSAMILRMGHERLAQLVATLMVNRCADALCDPPPLKIAVPVPFFRRASRLFLLSIKKAEYWRRTGCGCD